VAETTTPTVGVGVPRRGAQRQNRGMSSRIMGWLPFALFLVLAAAGSLVGYLQFRG
jgi:hypothetical protein